MLTHSAEKMVFFSSTTTTSSNEWKQNHIDDEKRNLMDSTTRMASEDQEQQQKNQHQHQQQPQQPLKCPRCDSLNTKFCYYNNYSLTQPRHFCKACKRYWTRGGTLRNVPVGGGNRRNKRVKRSSSSSSAIINNNNQTLQSTTSAAARNPNSQSRVDLSSSSSMQINPMFYGLPSNPPEMNPLFPRFNEASGYDFQPQLNVPGLGFSSSGVMGSEINYDNYRNGFNNSSVVTSNSFLSSYPNFGSSTSTLASLIASSLQHQKFTSNGFKDMQGDNSNNFQGLLQMEGDVEGGGMMKESKIERGSNRMNWDIHNNQDQVEHMNSSDPSVWNTSGVGSWLDPSVTSLI